MKTKKKTIADEDGEADSINPPGETGTGGNEVGVKDTSNPDTGAAEHPEKDPDFYNT